jgi:putative acyl-CoA dehydrogenase
MENVLADLIVESVASTALALRLARAFEAEASESEKAFARLATPAVKYWVCKRAPAVVAEAMEVLGGNGYVEDSELPRLYREAPLNSIWEGSGNVIALDVLRAARRERDAVEALLDELAQAHGANVRLDRHALELAATLRDGAFAEREARRVASAIAAALAASILVRHAPAALADAFCASRLGSAADTRGTLPEEVDLAAVIATRAP